MSPVKKANLIAILLIAIIALGTSSAVASYSGDYVKNYLKTKIKNGGNDESNKLTTVSDEDFKPKKANEIPIIIKNNTTNNTNSTVYNNTTYTNQSNENYYNNNTYDNNQNNYNYNTDNSYKRKSNVSTKNTY